jgi:hypothetical protein
MNNKPTRKTGSRSGEIFAWLVIGPILIIIFGTIIGLWIKFFWIGWVFAR